MNQISRRDFLKIAIDGTLWLSGALGLTGIFQFLSYEAPPPPPRIFDLGPESNYPLNSRTVLPDVPALLIHSKDGFSALSLVCTHLGCTVEATTTGFDCPCHGSSYELDGSLANGPATSALETLRIEQAPDGNLVLYKS